MTTLAAGHDFLKCDAPDCDHFEQTPVTIEIVDKPCPKCGANLCTKDDFVTFRAIVAANRAANEVMLREHPNAPLHLMAINVDNGVLKVARGGVVVGKNPFPNKPVQS